MHGSKWARITERGLSLSGAATLRGQIPAGAVAVSCIGWQMGKAILTDRPTYTNQQINSIIPNAGVDPEYLYYYFATRRNELLSIGSAGGVRTPIISKSSFEALEVELPELGVQRDVAVILSAYDDLIENNTRRIAILEEMARRIYEEWFVRFRFPGHEDMRMVDSELGPVPIGWVPSSVLNLCDFVKGVEPGRTAYRETPGEGMLPFLRVGDLSKRSAELYIDRRLAKGNELTEDDVAISLDGTVGVVRYGLRGAYSGGIRKIVPTHQHCGRAFLYQYLRSDYAQSVIRAHANGATILHAGGSVQHLRVAVPSHGTLRSFEELVQPMMRRVTLLERTNSNLRTTRDLLLPKLISGELDVSAATEPEALAA
jgi:type I restriction enzyme, S subunit